MWGGGGTADVDLRKNEDRFIRVRMIRQIFPLRMVCRSTNSGDILGRLDHAMARSSSATMLRCIGQLK